MVDGAASVSDEHTLLPSDWPMLLLLLLLLLLLSSVHLPRMSDDDMSDRVLLRPTRAGTRHPGDSGTHMTVRSRKELRLDGG